jgi:hypothetical protein
MAMKLALDDRLIDEAVKVGITGLSTFLAAYEELITRASGVS